MDPARAAGEAFVVFERQLSLANIPGQVDVFPVFPETRKRWDIKYFEGFVTSKESEARTYFSNMQTCLIQLDDMGKESDEVIGIALNKEGTRESMCWSRPIRTHTSTRTSRASRCLTLTTKSWSSSRTTTASGRSCRSWTGSSRRSERSRVRALRRTSRRSRR